MVYIYNIYSIYTYVVFYVYIGITIYIYIYIRTKTYDIDIVKEVSIHSTSNTIIKISVWLAYLDIRYEQVKYIVVCIQTIYIILIENNI